jgi:predicted O-linked N-acetylglucosamine transferase (SPINDLY family)
MKAKNKRISAIHPLPLEKTPEQREINALIQAFNRGQYDVVEGLALAMTRVAPHFPFGWKALGVALGQQDKTTAAVGAMQKAVQLGSGDAEVHFNLGTLLKKLGRKEEAESALAQAIHLQPGHVLACNNLGNLLREMGRLDESEAMLRQTLRLKPDYAEAHNNLGNVLQDLGRLEESLVSFQRAIKLNPDYTDAHSNLLFVFNYVANETPFTHKADAQRYGALVSRRRTHRYTDWFSPPSPTKLRIGFVSGDFRNHPVGFFLESLLANIDPARFELFSYTTQGSEDELTTRIKPFFAEWRELSNLSDEAAAKMIHADALHLLIDLSGHTAKNRLPVFACKPAPIQVTWLGYFATTGVAEIDYWLSDPYVLPEKEEDHFTEAIWRLPETYLCFTPPTEKVEINPLPALSNGCVTFGCFNNLTKMNDAVVALWATVLNSVPSSRLFLKTRQLDDKRIVEEVLSRFAIHGILIDRLILEGRSPRAELLASYNRVDIALDPFPYPGGTTTLEALWMGVPVLTKCGDRFLSHIGESIARNAQQTDWIAHDDEDYVRKAVKFSTDLDKLAALRSGLREQVLASPLFDSPRFARHFEAAMWGMWNKWRSQGERIT